ncbi:MAG: hypothetical protein JWO38_4875 [Gemmataceae bacterium]|nr:hypothetical protein [Gemmataceae bacterium]
MVAARVFEGEDPFDLIPEDFRPPKPPPRPKSEETLRRETAGGIALLRQALVGLA